MYIHRCTYIHTECVIHSTQVVHNEYVMIMGWFGGYLEDPCALIQSRPSGCQSDAHHWYVDGKTTWKTSENYGKIIFNGWELGKNHHLKNGWERNGDLILVRSPPWSDRIKVPCSLQLHRPAIQCDHWLPKELEFLRLEPINACEKEFKDRKSEYLVMFDFSHDIKSSQISSNFWIVLQISFGFASLQVVCSISSVSSSFSGSISTRSRISGRSFCLSSVGITLW